MGTHQIIRVPCRVSGWGAVLSGSLARHRLFPSCYEVMKFKALFLQQKENLALSRMEYYAQGDGPSVCGYKSHIVWKLEFI